MNAVSIAAVSEGTVSNANLAARPPALKLDSITAAYGDVEVLHGLSVTVEAGQFVTLLGPSGCGKTTALRSVGGLEQITGGTITLAGRVVADGVESVAPEARDVNMVFQSYAIWPHMSVADNVGYGLRAQKVPKDDRVRRVREMLDMVGLGDFVSRSSMALSGGQQQRIALARALITNPALLLMDEPLSNLDAGLRARMRRRILEVQRATRTSTLYVTHDQSEALAMSDVIVVMNHGRIEQLGSPVEIYDRPRTSFVAGFIGAANLLEATVVEARADGTGVVTTAQGKSRLMVSTGLNEASAGDSVRIVLRPENISMSRNDVASESHILATVKELVYLGASMEVGLSVEGDDLRAEMPPLEVDAQVGDEVRLSIKGAIHVVVS